MRERQSSIGGVRKGGVRGGVIEGQLKIQGLGRGREEKGVSNG